MSHPEAYGFGEPAIGAHPWVRCIGDQIVRFVHPNTEDQTLRLLREADSPILSDVLNRLKGNLEEEIVHLAFAGVSVVKSTVEVCPIPVFDTDGVVVDRHLGLEINSEYIYGTPIEYYEPETPIESEKAIREINKTFNGLGRYLFNRVSAGKSLLKDIYTENQFVYGSTQPGSEPKLVLIDMDPYFMKPSEHNYITAVQTIQNTRDYLIRQMQ